MKVTRVADDVKKCVCITLEIPDADVAFLEADGTKLEDDLLAQQQAQCASLCLVRHRQLVRAAMREGFALPAGTVREQVEWGKAQGKI